MTLSADRLPRQEFLRICIDEVLTRFAEDFCLGSGYAYDVMVLIAETNDQLRSMGLPFYRWGVSSLSDRHRELVRLTDQVIDACNDINFAIMDA